VHYCHENNIVHRDIKPENILLEQGKDFDSIKIIDFGASLNVKQDETLSKRIGTPYYIAPEVIKGDYDSKCDLWSIGVLTYILMSGIPPFTGDTNKEIYKKVSTGKFNFKDYIWKKISSECKDFITQLLTLDKD
jgi:calcium-dependent protein kinase